MAGALAACGGNGWLTALQPVAAVTLTNAAVAAGLPAEMGLPGPDSASLALPIGAPNVADQPATAVIVVRPPQAESPRFLFLDGLRGVAAMMVVVFHLFTNLRPATRMWFPAAIAALFLNGDLGVDIFFVLSGFVIAQSVRDGERSLRYLGRFALRRSLRLDPPLWITIFVEIALIRISLMLFPGLATPLPAWREILTNITYIQHFVGTRDIQPVFWSLTYEVQFYVVLVGALVILHRLGVQRLLVRSLFAAAFFWSLAVWLGAAPLPMRGLFIDRWFQFALGIAAWAVFTGHISKTQFAALCTLTILGMLALHQGGHRARSIEITVLSAVTMAVVSLTGRLETLFSSSAIQFLGEISYSLYLIHLSIGWRFISIFRKEFGPQLGPAMGTTAFVGGIVLSVIAARLMYLAIEAPSVSFARQVRLPRRRRVLENA
jgi:peptidoglycan/LPS O-acetylase OafA/YrhL